MQTIARTFWGERLGPVRLVGMPGPMSSRRLFMGQTPAAAPAPTTLPSVVLPPGENRLLNVKISSILDRLVLDPAWTAYIKALHDRPPEPTSSGRAFAFQQRQAPVPEIPELPADDKAVLEAVRRNPTQEELEDLSVIDSFYLHDPHFGLDPSMGRVPEGFIPSQLLPCTPADERMKYLDREPKGKGPPLPQWFWKQQREAKAAADALTDMEKALPDLSKDPFFCTKPIAIPGNQYIQQFFGRGGYFGIDESKPWGAERVPVWNSISFLGGLDGYPAPRPIPAMPGAWYNAIRADSAKFVHTGLILNPALARFWITLETLQVYDSVSNQIIAELKRQAKKKKRQALIQGIVIAVAGTILTFGLAAAIAPAIAAIGIAAATAGTVASAVATTAVQVGQMELAAQEKRQAAKDLEKISKQFEAGDAGYAAEMDKAAQILDYEAAQEERAAKMSQEEIDALTEGGPAEIGPEDVGGVHDFKPEQYSTGPSTALLVGGGLVAAAGAGALLLFA
jgi:hypothetical protein